MTAVVEGLTDADWEILIERIKDKRCTPFIGPGVRVGGLSLGATVAQKWASAYDYPLQDSNDLARVGRYLSVRFDADFTKKRYMDVLRGLQPPSLDDENEDHMILASLSLPVYITTNYDDFMMQALKRRDKDPRRELCRWKKSLADRDSHLSNGFNPNAANPIVFHLYGYPEMQDEYPDSLESLVLTEDDYIEFLINTSKDGGLIPPRIQRAMTGASLLLLGYRLDDWDFRILFHLLLANYLDRNTSKTHVAVQIAPVGDEAPGDLKRKVEDYLHRYLSKKHDIRVYWGTSQRFLAELKKRGGF